MDTKTIKEIEFKLNVFADVYYKSLNREVKELNRGYCQGVAFVLEQIGYRVEWDNGKATVVRDD